ncbi:MAG: mechanosensitive ion channel [Nitriliruptoraceae bacterium]|nr:mechanosensitive ion channel [Nitriliruptoraceae bacterium]
MVRAVDDGEGIDDVLRDVDPPADAGELWELLLESVQALSQALIQQLPVIALGLLLFIVGLIVIKVGVGWTARGLSRARVDHAVERLTVNLMRSILVLLLTLWVLSVAGVRVGAVLAGLGLAGLALAFALQNILENFVAGILILIRKPFRRGDQIESHEFAGTVEDIDLRVTHVRDFDDQLVLIPNATVFTHPIVNFTRMGRRRTRVTVGIDYRDDHDRAREVLLETVRSVEGVRSAPEPEVLCTQLGESSVDFEVSFWTAPQMREVRFVRDRVLRACKSAVEAEGMTIPWPIRTLAADMGPLRVAQEHSAGDAPAEDPG